MQTVLFNKQKGFEKEQQEMSAGKERPLDNSFPCTQSQPTCFCRLLSFFPPVPIQAQYWKQQEIVSCESCDLPFIASGQPSPSGQLARMLLAQWSICTQNVEAPLQPWAFVKRPDLNAAQPRRSLCCQSPDSFKTAKKKSTLREMGMWLHGKWPHFLAPALWAG